MKPRNEQIIQRTKCWIEKFIIAHNICPFAKRVFDEDSIAYRVINETDVEKQLHVLIDACVQLDSEESIETALVIFPHGLENFDEYLDFLALANALLKRMSYEGVYQLASFHPEYCFEGANTDDPENYTNRSPYPMLHLIRESSLEKALQHYPDPEQIPVRNMDYLRRMGLIKARSFLSQCLETKFS